MPEIYFCRVGCHGQVGKFRSLSSEPLERGHEVVVRTARGVEIGEVLSSRLTGESHPNEESRSRVEDFDGKLLRRATPEDRLLRKHLFEAAQEAFESCQSLLRELDCRDCLVDVEPMMDGKTLYFHFLGTPDDQLASSLQPLAETFRETVMASQFAKLLDEGCGPGCGSEEKGGCGDGGTCSVCVIAQACKK